MLDLGTLGGGFSEGWAMNNRQEVVGWSEDANGRTRAFFWRPGHGMQSLGTLGGTESSAFGINDARQVVGSSLTADGNSHAFLWTPGGGMEDLGTLGGKGGDPEFIGNDM